MTWFKFKFNIDYPNVTKKDHMIIKTEPCFQFHDIFYNFCPKFRSFFCIFILTSWNLDIAHAKFFWVFFKVTGLLLCFDPILDLNLFDYLLSEAHASNSAPSVKYHFWENSHGKIFIFVLCPPNTIKCHENHKFQLNQL